MTARLTMLVCYDHKNLSLNGGQTEVVYPFCELPHIILHPTPEGGFRRCFRRNTITAHGEIFSIYSKNFQLKKQVGKF